MFLSSLPPDGPARDAVILGAIATGNLDPVVWRKVRLGRVTLEVSADYLCIAGEHVPMAEHVAQAAVDSLGAILPTPAIVDAIEAAAIILPLPTWAPPPGQGRGAQTSSAVFALCEERTRQLFEARGLSPEQLVAGHRKDVVLARYMPPGVVVIYGARWPDGRRLQPLYPIPGGLPGHEDEYEDYSHGVRAVRDVCLLDGQQARVADLLARGMLGGPVARLRYETATATPAPTRPAQPPTAAIPSPGTATATLRRGDSGPRVVELQRLLTAAGWYVRADGAYGPLTESAVRAFQDAHGLAVDGLAGKATLAALREAAADAPPDTEPAPAEAISFVQARNYHVGRQRPVRCVVIHTMEAAEKPTTAENVAKWFASAAAPMASAHYCIDADSVVQGVREEDTAFAAPGLNADGIQLEHAGYAAQSAADWSDDYSRRMLARSAKLVAGICARHGIPIAFVDAAGLLRGERGITTHAEVSKAYRQSTHTDPGRSFPMADYLAAVRA